MKPTLKAGLALGILVAAWTFLMGFTGWYKHPTLLNLFHLVILIQICVLIWGLKQTAAEGRTYWPQVGAGTLMSVIGGAIIFCSSILFTTVAFPRYFEELKEIHTQMMQAEGLAQATIDSQVQAMAATQTPLMQAGIGAVATVITGFIVSLVIAAFVRNRAR